jgi:hypothetical protein
MSEISSIDKMIQSAKARKAMRDAGKAAPADSSGPDFAKATEVTAESKAKRAEAAAKEKADKDAAAAVAKVAKDAEKLAAREVKKTEAAAKKEQRDAERLVRKGEKAMEREAKKAEKPARNEKAHMSKVDKAAAKLPKLGDDATNAFNDLTVSLPADQIAALAQHLLHFNRAQATQRALSQKLNVGDQVEILAGDSKAFGMVGIVSKAQRIRCFVDVEGFRNPVYLFSSDVKVIAPVEMAIAKSA